MYKSDKRNYCFIALGLTLVLPLILVGVGMFLEGKPIIGTIVFGLCIFTSVFLERISWYDDDGWD